jgi:hypothetical protein
VALLALDIISSIFFPPPIPRFALIIAIIFRVLILFTMTLGYSAIRSLKQAKPCSDQPCEQLKLKGPHYINCRMGSFRSLPINFLDPGLPSSHTHQNPPWPGGKIKLFHVL